MTSSIQKFKSLPKKKTVPLRNILESVSKTADISLSEVTDALCDVISESPTCGDSQWVIYDASGEGLALPKPEINIEDIFLNSYNECWWENQDDNSDATLTNLGLSEGQAAELVQMVASYLDAPVADLSSASLDGKITRLREESNRFYEQNLQAVRNLADWHQNDFLRAICEAVLDIENNGAANPFILSVISEGRLAEMDERDREKAALENRSIALCKSVYVDAATVCLATLNWMEAKDYNAEGKGTSRIKEESALLARKEYIQLSEWIHVQGIHPRISAHKIRHPFGTSLIYGVFDGCIQEEFSRALADVCRLIYHGVPIYESINGSMKKIGTSSWDYIYLFKKGEHSQGEATCKFPYWVTKYWFRASDLDAYRRFFPSDWYELSEDSLKHYADAFRRQIGEPEQAQEGGEAQIRSGHDTRLLRILSKLIKYASAENEWPKQSTVFAWLTQNYPDVTGAEQRALDAVSRPEHLRKKR